MGFTLKFEHVSDDRKFDAHLTDWLDGSDDIVKAEFVIEDAQVTRLGLQLEEMLKASNFRSSDTCSNFKVNPIERSVASMKSASSLI
jgi:hypothetical protein